MFMKCLICSERGTIFGRVFWREIKKIPSRKKVFILVKKKFIHQNHQFVASMNVYATKDFLREYVPQTNLSCAVV